MSQAFDIDRFGHITQLDSFVGKGANLPPYPWRDQIKPKAESLSGSKQTKINLKDEWRFEGKANPESIQQDSTRDELLTEFGKATLLDRYLLPGESFQDLFARVSAAYADDDKHAQRLYDAMSQLWFMPATPVLSNGGANRGLPISCFLNEVNDNLASINDIYQENLWLAANGGGIGTYWGGVRSIGEPIGRAGTSSGIIPFVRATDSLTLAISQGSLRRGSAAVYLDVHHPEIEEFLEIRKPTGDFNRKCLNLHHGLLIDDAYMEAVRHDEMYELRSPNTGQALRSVSARDLWQRILETRMQTGEPYIVYIDHVNKALAPYQRKAGLKVKTSNLCSEIMLPTGTDKDGRDRTAVCCLSSLNLETYDQWKDNKQFLEDVFRFLDNVLQSFIQTAPPVMEKAIYSATQERSIGLGLMGFHSYLQSKNIPFESAMAKAINKSAFSKIRAYADQISYLLAIERGSCPDAQKIGMMQRFSHKLAIAPTASISIICGETSACIEPIPANFYTHKTLSGSFSVKNKYLQAILMKKGLDTDETWKSIIAKQGSVQHLEGLDQGTKNTFKTAFEIDQRWVIDLAADRTPYICQGQSLNIYLQPDISKWDLMMIHWRAWELGVKSLYYCRSKSLQRAAQPGAENTDLDNKAPSDGAFADTPVPTNYDECLSCQ